MKRLESLISGEKLCKHTLNDSKSKFQYSFSKSKRFRITNNNSVDKFYNNNDCLSKRSTSFGTENRFIYKGDKGPHPEPGTYNVTNSFIIKNRKFSFGNSRVY